MNISERFIDFILEQVENADIDKLSGEINGCILDYVGCALAGSKIIDENMQPVIMKHQGEGNTPVIGKDIKATAISAALVNAMEAHIAELDDGHRYAMLHPGTPVISALISAVSADMIDDGTQFIKGIIAGYEVTCRLAQAIQPNHKLKGYHATGTCGTVGAAVAVGIAAGFTKEQLMSALSAAVTSASGVLEMIDDSSQLKPYNVGQAAMNGYLAACMGMSGFRGPKDPLGGNRGFFKVLADGYNEEVLMAQETTYKFQQRYTKAYAACRHCHPAIEAVLKIVEKGEIKIEHIQYINVYTYALAIHGHDQSEVEISSAAKMSTPFSVATAIINKNAGLQAFDEKMIGQKDIMELANKVYVYEDEELTAISPGKRAAIVEIHLENGQKYSYRVDYPLGEPENPMSMDAIEDKYWELGRFSGISENRLKDILDSTKEIKKDLKKWLNLL